VYLFPTSAGPMLLAGFIDAPDTGLCMCIDRKRQESSNLTKRMHAGGVLLHIHTTTSKSKPR
jgi:hypothetical protein